MANFSPNFITGGSKYTGFGNSNYPGNSYPTQGNNYPTTAAPRRSNFDNDLESFLGGGDYDEYDGEYDDGEYDDGEYDDGEYDAIGEGEYDETEGEYQDENGEYEDGEYEDGEYDEGEYNEEGELLKK